MDEFGNELEELRREVVESRSLTIKTNNLVNALAADLKSIAKRQDARERRMLFNNAAIYLISLGVLLFVLKLAWDARVTAVTAEAEGKLLRLQGIEKELEDLRQSTSSRGKSGKAASEFYQLVQNDKRKDLIERWPEVSKLPLTRAERAVFADAVEGAKNDLSLIRYQEGLDHIRTRRWHEARQSLNESLAYKGNAAHSPQARYHLAKALKELGDQRQAIPILMKLSEASADREVMDDATFLLAEAQVEIEAFNDAKSTLRSFVRRFPKSPYINDARMLAAELALKR